MGQHADDIIEGNVCQICGEWNPAYLENGEEQGFPFTCEECEEDEEE